MAKKRHFDIQKELVPSVRSKLGLGGFTITVEESIPFGWQIKTSGGAVVNIYTTGRIVVAGKNTEELQKLFK